MIALDTDVLTLYLQGNPLVTAKVDALPVGELVLPVVVVEEVMRGRLNAIRQAQAGQLKLPLSVVYAQFVYSLQACQHFPILNYTDKADQHFKNWRMHKVRIPTQDLRIAAICAAENASLATRNRRDFDQIPDLSFDIWA